MVKIEEKYCKCGCGERIVPWTCCNKEYQKDLADFRRGHHTRLNLQTEEQKKEIRKKISETKKGHPVSRETREKISIAKKGKKLSEEHKKKISDGTRGKPTSARTRTKISIAKKGKSWEEAYGACRSLEYKKNKSKSMQKKWKDSEYREKQIKLILKGWKVKPNNPEKKLCSILHDLFPNEYYLNVYGDMIIAGKVPDFVNVNGQKKIVEMYGDYWHKEDDPQDRISLFKRYGYSTLVVWECELKNVDKVKNKLVTFHKE